MILKQGILDKKKGLWSRWVNVFCYFLLPIFYLLFSRRRMFLLTEGPRLFYVDPKEMVLKGEIPMSKDMKTEMKDFR